jgi:hypothetical protein
VTASPADSAAHSDWLIRQAYGLSQPPMGKSDHIDARDTDVPKRPAYQKGGK